jgi:tripartite-type tricarboxylate transporter receptor subunit TctC
MRRSTVLILAVLLALSGWVPASVSARAETYPAKPVRLFVPYPPGGAVDILGRLLGQQLAVYWGQVVVIDNRPGAGGAIATEALAKSAPDGYSLILVASGHAVNPVMYRKLPYDTFKDFTAISEVAWSPNIVLVGNAVPAHSLGELIALARAQPGQLSYGMPGYGTSPHLSGELLKYMAKIDIAAVPYKGGAPSLSDLMAGQIPVSINNVPESIAQIRAGTVRALAVTSAQRSPLLPDVPTVAEAANLPGYATPVWWGVLAPAGQDPAITEKIHGDLVRALADPTVAERLATLGATPIGNTPAEFDALIRQEAAKWAPVVKAAGIHLE